jgi:hypothetical protein
VNKKRNILFFILAAALTTALVAPAGLAAQAGKGNLEGTVYQDDLKTPVANAVIKLKNVLTGEVFQSKPTNAQGAYSLSDLPEGRYILGITTPEGNFNFDYEVFIKNGETGKLPIALKKGVPPMAVASLAKKAFFATPLGIATALAGGGALVGGVLLANGGDSSPTKK